MSNRRIFFRTVIPSVMAFALTGVYSIVDGFFIGNRLGDGGLAAINLAYPITAFMQAIGTGLGLSGAVRYTILRGQNQHEGEKESFASTFLLLLIFSVLLTLLVSVFLSPLLHVLGASGTVYKLSREYIQVIAVGTVCQILATGFIPFIRNMGGSSFAMFTMIAGFGTNIVLDYLFVWAYHLGMAGAALATVVGQAVAVIAAAGYLIKGKIGFTFPAYKKLLRHFAAILTIAVAPFGLTFSSQITTILMNRFLMTYHGEQAVAVYGCIAYIVVIAYLLLQGVGDGSQPLISQYYGERNSVKVKEIRRLAYITGGVIAAICMAVMFFSRGYIGILFGASAETNIDIAKYLPLFLSPLLFLAYIRITTTYLYATEKALLSYLLVYAEPVMLLFLLLLLPQIPILSEVAVWLAVPIAQFITWGLSLVVKRYADKQMPKKFHQQFQKYGKNFSHVLPNKVG